VKILVIEDNHAVAAGVCAMLERCKYAVTVTGDGADGLNRLLGEPFDAAIVDVMLPVRDGFSIARSARREGIHTPILMLTARDAVEDRVSGLESGADDYLIKPFVEEELIARVKALLRRKERQTQSVLAVGKLTIDVAARNVAYDGVTFELRATEFRLLEFMMRNAGRTFSREQLLERLWDYNFEGSGNIVDVYISQLRRKLKSHGAHHLLQTVWGVGYRCKST